MGDIVSIAVVQEKRTYRIGTVYYNHMITNHTEISNRYLEPGLTQALVENDKNIYEDTKRILLKKPGAKFFPIYGEVVVKDVQKEIVNSATAIPNYTPPPSQKVIIIRMIEDEGRLGISPKKMSNNDRLVASRTIPTLVDVVRTNGYGS